MIQRTMHIALMIATLIAVTCSGDVFVDTFDAARDYLTAGTAGSGWDGFIGAGPQETASAINASISRPGQLYLESAGAFWEGAFNPRGPFLYKVVEGDFIATVRVTDFPGMPGSVSQRTTHADAFLMARLANLEDGGPGEDFVCVHYFPTWVGNLQRQVDNGVESELTSTGDGFNCATYLQLERQGNTFFFRISYDGQTWSQLGQPITRDDMAGLPVQVGLAQCTYSTNRGYVAFDDFRLEGPNVRPARKMAVGPSPSDKSSDVPRDVDLAWKPVEGASSRDVYLGTDLQAVSEASRSNPMGVLVSRGQTSTTYDPGLLAYGQQYYWRIDEVNGVDGTLYTGQVWTFTVEPYGYPVGPVNATASSSSSTNTLPTRTINGAGLDPLDQHSVLLNDMWVSKKNVTPIWIQYEFDNVYKFHQMWVWNSNSLMEQDMGYGAKDVEILYSEDGQTWNSLGMFEFAQAPGEPTYKANSIIELGKISAKYIKLDIKSSWGGLVQASIAEVRFFSVPLTARQPS
ncbi:MAG: discoidin domain-containing protein, partial [Sedimentisphaerales bacterium]|nr:discoidin domain-containing protein [Sedimentisphaerales bacterium]